VVADQFFVVAPSTPGGRGSPKVLAPQKPPRGRC